MRDRNIGYMPVVILALLVLLPAAPAAFVSGAGTALPEGFESISYRDMTSVNKVTLISHDRTGIVDDYAYLAEVPASVFHSSGSERVFMNPVLFYEKPMQSSSDAEKVQDTYASVKYLMEDMMTVSGGGLNKIELVCFDGASPGEVGSDWTAAKVKHIDSTDPYVLSSEVALENWEYSDTAVIAVVNGRPKAYEQAFSGEITGRTPDASTVTGSMSGSQDPSPVDPNTHPFTIEPDYKYITSQLTWGQDWNPLSELTERGKDPDLQLYDGKLGMVGASEKWNVLEGASEEIGSYVYNAGDWEFAVTYMPTKNSLSLMEETWGSVPEPSQVSDQERERYLRERITSLMTSRSLKGLSNDALFGSTVEYTIDYTLYPGIDVPQKVETPFYCRDAKFTLEWSDTAQNLGLILRGPEGAEIAVAIEATTGTQVIEVPELGKGEYQVSVVNLGESATATDFKVKYEFKQKKDEWEGTFWAGAANGAVIATAKNAPLMFTGRSELNDAVGKALNTLGVRKVYVIDVDGHASKEVYSDIDALRGFFYPEIKVERIDSFDELYDLVRSSTTIGGTATYDIVFSTINPWSYWNVLISSAEAMEEPRGEHAGALFVGPAALAGAVHGAPVFITDAHPELSTAQAWHNKFWVYAYQHGRAPPSVACMSLTAKDVYAKVVDRYGFDKKAPVDENGKTKESIITVADQFDIGSSWDRAFVGAADSGRIMGSPVDTAMWVSRSAIYPKLVFANPAVKPELDGTGGMRIQGSSSTRIAGALVIENEKREEQVDFPVAMTWVSYQYKFNEQASYYWGCPYTTRTGITPYFDMSDATTDPDGIDPEGRYPDLDCSVIIPDYLEAAGYGTAYTTTFESTMENLNRGAIMWLEVMHGGHTGSGVVGWWNENGAVEEEPWRGYEEAGIPYDTLTMRWRGATDNPDVITMSKHIGLDVTPGIGPITDAGIIPERHDGVVIAIAQQSQTEYSENGLVMDGAMENLHSLGFSAGSCLIANTYLHLSMVRHGSLFQVIDPWLTSWYSAFAMNMFVRDIYYGRTIGDAYERGISHVGIEYLIDGWWWDIFENLVYYGDPDIKVFSPKNAWAEPAHLAKDAVIDGHAPDGADGHPHSTSSGLWLDLIGFGTLLAAVGVGAYIYYRWNKGMKVPFIGAKKSPSV